MHPDTALVLGLIIGMFSIPSIVSAFSDGRAPRASMLTILIGGGFILYAISNKSGGYAVEDVPDVFFSVLGRFFS